MNVGGNNNVEDYGMYDENGQKVDSNEQIVKKRFTFVYDMLRFEK